MDKKKIAVFTGAGISAESGLDTFRDNGGLWAQYAVAQVCTPGGWREDPETVLQFYNERRREVLAAEPNAAHLAIARLQTRYEVSVITQNIDDLHERAGSQQVIHLHGEIQKARSTADAQDVLDLNGRDIQLGDVCALGAQLRPHVVWFGESVLNYESARQCLREAGRVLAVGSSLSVYPAASLLKKARFHAQKYLIAFELEMRPFGYRWIRAKATQAVPHLVDQWLLGDAER